MSKKISLSAALRTLSVAAVLGLGFSASHTWAQSVPLDDIDALVDASAGVETGLSTAAAQSSAGDISGAATTLERVLLNDPDAASARVNYVTALCQLDDQQAAQFEIAKLSGQGVTDAAWAGIEAACGPVAKPIR